MEGLYTLRRHWRIAAILSPIAGALTLAFWLWAGSAPATANQGTITLDPSSGPPGEFVDVIGVGWSPSPGKPAYEIYWDSKGGEFLEDFTPDVNGDWVKLVTIPNDPQIASPGKHEIVVCEGVGGQSQKCVSESFTVEEPTATATGTSTATLTPAPATATPTPTSTPAAATSTSTSTPVGPTATPTATLAGPTSTSTSVAPTSTPTTGSTTATVTPMLTSTPTASATATSTPTPLFGGRVTVRVRDAVVDPGGTVDIDVEVLGLPPGGLGASSRIEVVYSGSLLRGVACQTRFSAGSCSFPSFSPFFPTTGNRAACQGDEPSSGGANVCQFRFRAASGCVARVTRLRPSNVRLFDSAGRPLALNYEDGRLACGGLLLNRARITQGLEFDSGDIGRPSREYGGSDGRFDGTSYELIALKDTLVRAELSSGFLRPPVTNVSCTIVHLATGARTTVRVAPRAGGVAYQPVDPRTRDGSPVYDCWAPGSSFPSPGTYRFEMSVVFGGDTARPETVPLGTRTFVRSAQELSLFVFTYLTAPMTSQYVPELYMSPTRDTRVSYTRAVVRTMIELNRLLPLPTGVRSFIGGGGFSGLQFASTWTTAMWRCPLAAAQAAVPSDPIQYCWSQSRVEGERAANAYNAAAGRRGAPLADKEYIVGFIPDSVSPTGQAQGFPSHPASGASIAGCSPASGINRTGIPRSAAVIAQELMHCYGFLQQAAGGLAESPHSRGSTTHSTTVQIPVRSGAFYRAAHTIDQRTQRNVNAWMKSVFGQPAFLEGYEWNQIRDALLNYAAYTGTTVPPIGAGLASDQALFQLSALIDQDDNITVHSSAREDDLDLELTTESPASPYALVFLDGGGGTLDELRFDVAFEGTDHLNLPVLAPLYLVAKLPVGSAGIEIRKDAAVLYARTFSAEAPVVSSVVAADSGDALIDLQWDASDADGDALTFDIYLQPGTDEIPTLIASALQDQSLGVSTEFAPATSDARLLVVASDGFNTAQAESNPFTIPAQPPLAGILAPSEGDKLVAGQPIALAGFGLGASTGMLGSENLSWISDVDGPLGTGEELHVTLSVGEHLLTLSASGPSGLTGEHAVQVTVLADADSDGMQDAYELLHGCLDASQPDSDQDPDGDLLASLAERDTGSDPCDPDTDDDGVNDGDEANLLGGDPLDGATTPLPELLSVTDHEVDLGFCPTPATGLVEVATTSPDLPWGVSSDSAWLTVVGGGTGDGSFTLAVDCAELELDAGLYTGQVAVAAEGSQPHFIEVLILGGEETILLVGDVNCDETINSIDATLVLQFSAALVATLSCMEAADVNADGNVSSLDATLILQLDAGLIETLPPGAVISPGRVSIGRLSVVAAVVALGGWVWQARRPRR